MNNRKKIIEKHYQNYNEDERLIKDNTHNIEFVISKEYIKKYLNSGDKILEIGAGTGRYSLYYALEGYDVTSIEFVEHNLNILKSKITPNMVIRAEQGDAIDLSRFNDNEFDMTLVFGPLYHLYNDADINKAIEEAIRVTKQNSIIMIAYLSNDGVFADWGVDHLLDGYPNDFDSNFKFVRSPQSVFSTFYIEEFKNIMKKFNVTFLHNVATDGIANLISEKINNLKEEEFNVWIKYHLSVCEREELLGYSAHLLYICRKN